VNACGLPLGDLAARVALDAPHPVQPVRTSNGPEHPSAAPRRRRDRHLLVVTHPHSDHTGGADALPEARIAVQRRELQYAAAPYFPVSMYDRRDIRTPYLADPSVTEQVPPGYVTSIEETMRALERIRREADHVLPMHDPAVYERYPDGVR
jgi:ribonuclease BN (tRNA processing enzyme)